MIKELTLMVGPPCSGKSTYSINKNIHGLDQVYANQDKQGKEHLAVFQLALEQGRPVIVDRMGFSKEQRARYLVPAKAAGYKTKIVVLHESRATCMTRGIERVYKGNHETIKTEEDLHNAVNFFFSKYEKVEDSEADEVVRIWPPLNMKLNAVIVDIDGTMANIDHRLHFVQGEGKRNWGGFFANMHNDTVNEWCRKIVKSLHDDHIIYMCSGRPDSYRKVTEKWLTDNGIPYDELFMRPRNDHRQDYIIKEILLDFEIRTRATPFFAIDDRQQVVDGWRKNGIVCLQCQDGKY